MGKEKERRLGLRLGSILLAVFAVLFGFTYKKNGFCLGDAILNVFHLSAWSDGTKGTHYSAVLALFMLMTAWILFWKSFRK